MLRTHTLSPETGKPPDDELIALCEGVIALERRWGDKTLRCALAYERQLAALRQLLAAANERADKAEAALAPSTP